MMRSLIAGFWVAIGCAVSGPAQALPLAEDVCAKLGVEKTLLETPEMLADVRVTPDAAKAFAKDRLDRVLHYLDVSAQVLFRCSVPTMADDTVPPDPLEPVDQATGSAATTQPAAAKPSTAATAPVAKAAKTKH